MVYNQEIEEIYTRLMQQIDAQKRVDKIKEILKNKKTLPFELMQNYIKDSRVDYQRNLSTLSKAYHHPCDAFCEEVLELICNHIGE